MNMLSFFVSIFFYVCFLSGLILLFLNPFKALYGWLSLRKRLPSKKQTRNKMFLLLDQLVYAYNGKENGGVFLLLISVFLFFFIFSLCINYYSYILSLIIALLVASVPFGSLVSKINVNRNRSSLEGPGYLSELYRQYRIENKNINKALENLSENKNDYPVCSKQSYMLLLRLRSASSQSEIKKHCNDFSFALGSTWGKNAASCIAAACNGVDISLAIMDIIKQLSLAKERKEEKKRLNSEALRMTSFLVPIMYVATIWISISYLGISPAKLLENQFRTAEGLLFFLLIVILFFANSVILNLVIGDSLDY